MANEEKIFLPQQHARRGKAGYKNLKSNMQIVDDKGKVVERGSQKK